LFKKRRLEPPFFRPIQAGHGFGRIRAVGYTLLTMRLQTLALIFLLVPVSAYAEIYKYVDENGQVTFTDVYRRGAKRLDVPSGPQGLTGKPQKRASLNPSPANFPRIDAATQRKRDDIRRQVLQDEIASERKNVDDARRQLALGSRLQVGERATDSTYASRVARLRAAIEQHEQNVSAIQRELSNLK
jgi:hypothetical protein